MIIYKTTCLVNGKIYIGQHECGRDCKNSAHECNYLGSGTIFKRALKKHGKENFKIEILEDLHKMNTKIAWFFEEAYIQKYDARNIKIGYNVAKASSSFMTGVKFTENHKRKISLSHLGKTFSSESKQKMGQRGENHHFFGKHHSSETKLKMSFYSGEKSHMYGKPAHNRKKIIQVNKDTKEIIKIWDCVSHASKSYNISLPNIISCCKGKRKTVFGFIWKYY